ncbi:hypothetical protein ACWEHA_24400 [Amycolatopsis nivea]
MAKVSRAADERVRLSDVDPQTGVAYCRERFRDLPGWVMDLVLGMGISAEQWNGLVERGEVLEVPCLDGWHRVPRSVNWRERATSEGWPGAARSAVAA